MVSTETTVRDASWWLERQLDNWARWMHAMDLPDGYPEESISGVHGYMIHTADSDAACEHMDAWLAEATNSAINGLVPAERLAIYREYGVIACFKFSRENYQEVLASAKRHVLNSLERRGVWMGE